MWVPAPLSAQMVEYRKDREGVKRVKTNLQHQLEERGVQMLSDCATLKRVGKQSTSHEVHMAVWHLSMSQG